MCRQGSLQQQRRRERQPGACDCPSDHRQPSRPRILAGKVPDQRAAVNRSNVPPLPNAPPSPTTPPMWITAKAPSLDEFEAMAHESFGRLPDEFRALCEGVIIRVDDFPTDEVLDELGAETEFDLLGLFQGVGLPQRSSQDIAPMPNMIWLYRRPILDYWAEHDETLGAHRQPRPDPRDRPPFRPVRRRHGSDRGAGGGLRRHSASPRPRSGRSAGLKDEQTIRMVRDALRAPHHDGCAGRTGAGRLRNKRLGTPAGPAKTRPQSGKIAMDKFTTLEGVAAPLKIINVDTDMIIPKQYLKTIKRTGLGKGLFSEQRYHDDGSENPDFVLNKPAYRKAPRSWSPATISAAARAASTPRGRCSISASAASSRPRSATSSTTTASRTASCRSGSRRTISTSCSTTPSAAPTRT